jgi:hypothetical protein
MRTKKLFWFICSGYVEIALLMIGIILHIIYTYGSIFWVVLAGAHFSLSYQRIRKYHISWYKEWNVFYGFADVCLATMLLLIAKAFNTTAGPAYLSMFLAIFLALAWFALLIWSGALARQRLDTALASEKDNGKGQERTGMYHEK